MNRFRLLLLSVFLLPLSLKAQDPLRFEKEVQTLTAGDTAINTRKLVLFTGSSSIRMWRDLQTDFPKRNILNRGFGGSEMSDLLYYTDRLVLKYQPKMIFIYEGDNDINSGKSAEEILQSAEELLARIRQQLPKRVTVIFISPKPSLVRKNLKEKYEDYNQKLKEWCSKQKRVQFADVWTPMLNSQGEVMPELFIEDGLHMNRKGYDIWKKVIEGYL